MKITLATILRSLLLLGLCAGLVAGQNATIWFSAFEKNDRFYPALTATDVEVREGKTAFRIERLTPKTDMPMEIVIMVDASASQQDLMGGEKDLAAYFIGNILKKDKDRVAIVRFSDSATLVSDLTANLEDAKASLAGIEADARDGKSVKGAPVPVPPTQPGALLAKINSDPGADKDKRSNQATTSVWNSTRRVIEAFAELKPTGARRAILLISDGVDTKGDRGFQEAIDSSLKNQIPVYPIAVNDVSVLAMESEVWLTEIALQTGGSVLLPQKRKRDGFSVDMDPLEQRMRNYYEVVVSADAPGEKDKARKLDIRIVSDALRKSKIKIFHPRGFTLN